MKPDRCLKCVHTCTHVCAFVCICVWGTEAECHPYYREQACSLVIGLFRSQEEAPSSEEETRPDTLLVISGDKAEEMGNAL